MAYNCTAIERKLAGRLQAVTIASRRFQSRLAFFSFEDTRQRLCIINGAFGRSLERIRSLSAQASKRDRSVVVSIELYSRCNDEMAAIALAGSRATFPAGFNWVINGCECFLPPARVTNPGPPLSFRSCPPRQRRPADRRARCRKPICCVCPSVPRDVCVCVHK